MDVKFSGMSAPSKKYTIAIGEPGSDTIVDFFGRAERDNFFASFDLTKETSRLPDDIISSHRPRYIPPSLVNGKVHIIQMTVDQYGKITILIINSLLWVMVKRSEAREMQLGSNSFRDNFMRNRSSSGFSTLVSDFYGGDDPDFSRLMVSRSVLDAGRAAFGENHTDNEPNKYWDDVASAHWFGTNILDYFDKKDITTESSLDTNVIDRTFIMVAPGENQFGTGNKFYIDGKLDYSGTSPRYSGIGLLKGKKVAD